MPEQVTLQPAKATASASKAFSFVLPRRGEVLASLKPGERLSVQVLERFGTGKVMLDIKGAAVTARALGEFPVGRQVEVMIERHEGGFILRQIGGDSAGEPVWLRLIRNHLGEMNDRNQSLARLLTGGSLDVFAHLRSGTGGAIARLGEMMSQLLRADEGLGDKLPNLATLFGLSPAGLGERLAEFFGRDIASKLDRLLGAEHDDFASFLQQADGLSPDDADKWTNLAGLLKKQIGLFRGMNALFDQRGLPLHLSLPFIYQGEPQPTDLWIYRRRDQEREIDDPNTVSALIRLTMSRLGEVRALVVLQGRENLGVSIYTASAETSRILNGFLPELNHVLVGAGYATRTSVREGLAERPLPDLTQLLYGGGERQLDVKA